MRQGCDKAMSIQENTAGWQSVGNIKKFLREVKIELKKVTWPTRQQLIAYTAVVMITVIVVALLIWVFDYLFSVLFRAFLRG
jgi:preprotein translocase subunit SecE